MTWILKMSSKKMKNIEKKSKKMHFLPRILFSGRLQTEKSKFER